MANQPSPDNTDEQPLTDKPLKCYGCRELVENCTCPNRPDNTVEQLSKLVLRIATQVRYDTVNFGGTTPETLETATNQLNQYVQQAIVAELDDLLSEAQHRGAITENKLQDRISQLKGGKK